MLKLKTLFGHHQVSEVTGYSSKLIPEQARTMMVIGWLSFFLAWIMNISFYAVHPSMVDLNLMKLKGKCSVHIFGRKMSPFHTQGNPSI